MTNEQLITQIYLDITSETEYKEEITGRPLRLLDQKKLATFLAQLVELRTPSASDSSK